MKMTISLGSPGMTALHKAGLAGLYMTLKALEINNQKIAGLTWSLAPKKVVLDWDDETITETFKEFIRLSFWTDEGFIRLTGLEISRPPNYEQKHHLNNALLNSFLQHGQHRSVGTKRDFIYAIDDRQCRIHDFAPIQEFQHQTAISDFISKSGHFVDQVEVSGWLYPGGGQRHVVYKDTKLSEPLELAIPLLFAPVGVIYYFINSRRNGRKARLALLIPTIKDLEEYAEIRQSFATQGTLEMHASSPSDAALRLLTAIQAFSAGTISEQREADEISCRLITFGIVSWNEKQKSRTYTRTIAARQTANFGNYRKAAAIFKNRWQHIPAKFDRKDNEVEPESSFVRTFSSREFIADNVAQGRAWYHDITNYLSNKEVREQLGYEREELNTMVEKATYDTESEQLFILVCHDSWRRRLHKLGQRATNERTSFPELARKDAEKLRVSFARCKNSVALRETVVDFWSRGGVNETLKRVGVAKLLPLFDERNWRKARDLALLSLISYRPANTIEENAFATDTSEAGGEDE